MLCCQLKMQLPVKMSTSIFCKNKYIEKNAETDKIFFLIFKQNDIFNCKFQWHAISVYINSVFMFIFILNSHVCNNLTVMSFL